MALREKLRTRVQPLLEPSEQIDSVFLAQTGPNPNLAFLTWLVLFWTRYDVIAVTDRRTIVFRASRFRPATPRAIAASYPREGDLAHESHGLWNSLDLGGSRYWVHRRFKKELEQTDAASATGG